MKGTDKMNKLSCAVKDCVNNACGLCCLEKIIVEGPSAVKCEGTSCVSFVAKRDGAQNSCAKNNCAHEETNIVCKAEHCVYNANTKCTASKVNVGCVKGAVCVSSETECETFKAK